MNGNEIMNSFERETLYEFSEAVPVFDDEIYFIFKADVISIDMNPSQTKMDKLKNLIKNRENSKSLISHLDIAPIAYLLKTEIDKEDDKDIESTEKEYDYIIKSIDEEYDSFVEKNRNRLLEEFLSNETKE